MVFSTNPFWVFYRIDTMAQDGLLMEKIAGGVVLVVSVVAGFHLATMVYGARRRTSRRERLRVAWKRLISREA